MISNQDSIAETGVTQESSAISSMTDLDQSETQAFKSFSKSNSGKPPLKRSDMHPASPSRLLADTSPSRTKELSPAFKAYCNLGATDLFDVHDTDGVDRSAFVCHYHVSKSEINPSDFSLVDRGANGTVGGSNCRKLASSIPPRYTSITGVGNYCSLMLKSVLLVPLSGQTEDL